MTAEGRAFFENGLTGYLFFGKTRSPHLAFDLAFKPCQIFWWQELHRLSKVAARICVTHQASIAIRCRHLAGPEAEILHANLPALVDQIITHSRFSKADFEAFYQCETNFHPIGLGTHNDAKSSVRDGGYLLIAGNNFPHKAVDQAAAALEGLGRMQVLGGSGRDSRAHISGNLTHSDVHDLFASASIVIYPSYYEGFGLPVIASLALGKHVVVLDTPVNRELLALSHCPDRLHLALTHRDMRGIVQTILAGGALQAAPGNMRTWKARRG